MKEAGATCKLAPSSDSINLESLTAKESIVVSVDSDLASQMTPGERNWVAQVNEFLQRLCVYQYTCKVNHAITLKKNS